MKYDFSYHPHVIRNMNVSPLLKKSIEVTLQEILPKMNARSNFFKLFPNYDVPGETVSSPEAPRPPSFLENLPEDAPDIPPISSAELH
jgi:hypothetical protein